MKRKFLLQFILTYIFFSFLYLNIENVFALQIRNVNYGASNNNDRWIEVFNDGADISDFTIPDYKVLDSKDATKHSVLILQGDNTFPANTSVFISPYTNIPTGATKAFRSNYTLDKTNGYVSIINSDGSGTYSCFAYGNISCPKANSVNNSSNNNSTSTNSTSTNPTSIISNPPSSPNIVYIYVPTNNQNKYGDITVLLPEEKIIPAGADTEFNVKVIDKDNKAITNLDFQWSFGDGGEKFGQKVSHYYTYPGEYTLVASADGYAVGGEAKMNVKVVIPDISISKVVSTAKENFIDLTNNTDYDLVLSNFYLNLDNTFYKLPKNFTILKGKTVHVSGEAVGFKLPATNISLNYPNKNLLISYLSAFNNSSSTTSSTTLESINTKDKINLLSEDISKSEEKRINISELGQGKNQDLVVNIDTKQENKKVSASFILKRLILNNEKEINSQLKSKNTNLNKSKNVDTGIVDWFKNLIY